MDGFSISLSVFTLCFKRKLTAVLLQCTCTETQSPRWGIGMRAAEESVHICVFFVAVRLSVCRSVSLWLFFTHLRICLFYNQADRLGAVRV